MKTFQIIRNIFCLGFFVSLLGNCGGFSASPKSQWIQTSCQGIEFVTQKQLSALTAENHQHLSEDFVRPACPGFMAIIPESRNLSLTQMSSCVNPGGIGPNPKPVEVPVIDAPTEKSIRDMMDLINKQNLQDWVEELTDPIQFPTRFHLSDSGKQVPIWIQNKFNQLKGNRDDVKVELWTHKNTPQKSVVVTIPGTSDSNQEEFVIIGGHEDSVNHEAPTSDVSHDRRAPGADDNASGIATLLEVFRVMMVSDYRPEKTIVFFAYAAEEIGLVGSQEIAASFKAQGAKVLGVLQVDMNMYAGRNSTYALGYVTDFTSPKLNEYSKDLAKTFFNQTLLAGKCGYACSDHASWTAAGYPSVFVIETDIESAIARIHSDRDVSDDLNYEYGKKFVKFALSFLVGLSHSKL